MTRIWFVRHGETDANKQKIVQGKSLNNPLNETGLAQASKVARRLQHEKLDHIFTSPQRRAYQTAEAISAYHPSTPLTVRFDLAENSMGRLEGKSLDEVMAEFPEDDWDNEDFRTRVGAESSEFYRRHFARHLPAWLQGHDGQTILVSTHGGKMKTILRSLVQSEFLEWVEREHPANTSLAEVEWSLETGGHLLRYNDADHLSS